MSSLYAIAIVATLLIFGGTAFIVVAIVGAMIVGLAYTATRPRTPN